MIAESRIGIVGAGRKGHGLQLRRKKIAACGEGQIEIGPAINGQGQFGEFDLVADHHGHIDRAIAVKGTLDPRSILVGGIGAQNIPVLVVDLLDDDAHLVLVLVLEIFHDLRVIEAGAQPQAHARLSRQPQARAKGEIKGFGLVAILGIIGIFGALRIEAADGNIGRQHQAQVPAQGLSLEVFAGLFGEQLRPFIEQVPLLGKRPEGFEPLYVGVRRGRLARRIQVFRQELYLHICYRLGGAACTGHERRWLGSRRGRRRGSAFVPGRRRNRRWRCRLSGPGFGIQRYRLPAGRRNGGRQAQIVHRPGARRGDRQQVGFGGRFFGASTSGCQRRTSSGFERRRTDAGQEGVGIFALQQPDAASDQQRKSEQ